jgi:exonuclease III
MEQIIVLNVHASREDKIYDVKDNFYEELQCVFNKFPKYRKRILLGYFNVKVSRKDTFKSTIQNECLHEISDANGVRVVNLATSKNLTENNTMFPHCYIHKYNLMS